MQLKIRIIHISIVIYQTTIYVLIFIYNKNPPSSRRGNY